MHFCCIMFLFFYLHQVCTCSTEKWVAVYFYVFKETSQERSTNVPKWRPKGEVLETSPGRQFWTHFTKRHSLVMMMMMMMMMIMMINYFCGMIDQRKALFPVRDPHHRESLTRHEQGFSSLNVCIKYWKVIYCIFFHFLWNVIRTS